jgi:serralysin
MVQASDFLDEQWELGESITYTFDTSALGFGEFSAGYETLFEDAMGQWSAVADITFEEISNPYTADLVIGWDLANDGPGGVLGWAVNFDYDLDGVLESSNGEFSAVALDPNDTSYFYTTAIHEVGDILGIGHIDHTESIMATYENGLEGLTAYDIEVIQYLYGPATSADIVSATDGSDVLVGSAGADLMSGAGGQDTLSGAAGDDLLYGNLGVDLLVGADGDDTIFGGQNDGTLTGDPAAQRDGVETVSGGAGDDLLYGNHGGDVLDGGEGWDTIYGGQDADTISGGAGWDDLYGNLGADTFVFGSGYEGIDRIHDFNTDEDRLQLASGAISSTNEGTQASYVFLTSGTVIELVGVQIADATAVTDFVEPSTSPR